jgi:hypothetical protein
LSFWFVVLDQFAGWRGRLTGSGDRWPLSADIIVFALRKSTAAPRHQDEQGFDPQRMASAQACLRRNRAPGRAACIGSRVQRGIASNPPASPHSQRIGARERFGDTQRKF